MTRLSNRQYPMLEHFATGVYMSIESAQHYDQRPFRSMLIRRWVAFKPGRGFHITEEGRAALKEFLHTDIQRKNPTLPLTAYFDPTAYGLRVAAKVKAIRRMKQTINGLFSIGNFVATPGAIAAIRGIQGEALYLLSRHQAGDWGEVDAHDKAANDHALKVGNRLLSAYTLSTGTRVWIITEADRSSTTLLLPEEY